MSPVELKAPTPAAAVHEDPRVAAARRLLGGGEGSEALDRLAELAARLLGCHAGQISLTTGVQTVVGASGLPDGLPSRRVEPPGGSLCEVTARRGSPLAVGDGHHDTDGLHVPSDSMPGAYLGVPVLTTAGYVVGTVCVFDPTSRAWSGRDLEVLEKLAVSVGSELELAALARDYESERLRWEVAVDAAGVGSFDADLSTGTLRWDARMCELMGVGQEDFDGTFASFTRHLHPDDVPRVRRAIDGAVARRGAYDSTDCRVLLPDGGERWVQGRGRVVMGVGGSPDHLIGTAHDTTDLHEGEARVARVLETMATAFLAVDLAGNLRYVNAEAERLLGSPRATLLGRPLATVLPATGAPPFLGAFRDAQTTGRPVVFEAPVPMSAPGDAPAGAGRWCEVRAWPSPDGLSVSLLDITLRRDERRRAAQAAARTTLLARVTADLAETLDAPTALARLARLVVPVLGDWCIAALAEEGGGHRDIGSWHAQAQARSPLARGAAERIAALSGMPMVARALRTGTPVQLPGPGDPPLDSGGLLGASWELVLPLRARGRSLGLLTIVRGQDRPAPSGDDVALAQEIGLRAALSLDNARLYAAQRELAEELQRSLLTDPPQPGGVQIVARYVPASITAQVGGDWYDAFVQPPGRTVVVIGDVVGHDSAAAAAMGQVRSLLRGIAHTTGAGPAEVLTRLDAAMDDLLPGTTATAALIRLDPVPGDGPNDAPGDAPGDAPDDANVPSSTRLTWANAGHPPPLVAIPGAGITVVDGAGGRGGPGDAGGEDLLLGIDATSLRHDAYLVVPGGSTLLLYTDGLVERRHEPLTQGLRRLSETFAALADLPLAELCGELLTRMVPGGHEDDIAIVALRLPG